LIKKNSAAALPRERLVDAESQRLLKLIEKKQKAKDDVAKRKGAKQPKVVDLLEVLQQALRKTSGSTAREDVEDTGDLSDLSKAELQKRAADLGISGRSSMTKDQLIGAIRKHAA
jgi:DNA end-binding protein Ku